MVGIWNLLYFFASFFMERKTPKEPFQRGRRNQGFLFPLKVTPNSFLMGKIETVFNRFFVLCRWVLCSDTHLLPVP
jgi:hypothetical protein